MRSSVLLPTPVAVITSITMSARIVKVASGIGQQDFADAPGHNAARRSPGTAVRHREWHGRNDRALRSMCNHRSPNDFRSTYERGRRLQKRRASRVGFVPSVRFRPLSEWPTLPECGLRVKVVSCAVQSAELKAPAPSTESGSSELPSGWTERDENTVAAREFGENQYETFARI
jgi:hypothetical protein